MSKPNKPQLKKKSRLRKCRWMLVPDIFEPNKWWVLRRGGWTAVLAPSFEEAWGFCEGFYGPAVDSI